MIESKLIDIVDDVLSDELFNDAVADFNNLKLAATLSSINPTSDGFAFRGPATVGFDLSNKWQLALHDVLISRYGPSDQYNWRATLYAPGSGISWHLDQGDGRRFAFNFYCTDNWDIDWGGELLYLKEPVNTRRDLVDAAMKSHGDNLGVVYPKPNRLAVIFPGCAHRVVPVSERAGDRMRKAWTGFAF